MKEKYFILVLAIILVILPILAKGYDGPINTGIDVRDNFTVKSYDYTTDVYTTKIEFSNWRSNPNDIYIKSGNTVLFKIVDDHLQKPMTLTINYGDNTYSRRLGTGGSAIVTFGKEGIYDFKGLIINIDPNILPAIYGEGRIIVGNPFEGYAVNKPENVIENGNKILNKTDVTDKIKDSLNESKKDIKNNATINKTYDADKIEIEEEINTSIPTDDKDKKDIVTPREIPGFETFSVIIAGALILYIFRIYVR